MADDDAERRSPAEPVEYVRMLTKAKHAVQTMLQYARDEAPEVAHLPRLLATQGWTNVGHAILGLVRHAGFEVSTDGKKLTWAADPAAKSLTYREKASDNSLKPKHARQTAMGRLDELDIVHDAAAVAGSRTAQAAAAAARPPVPQKLELVRPEAGERIGRVGTGWGNVPRPLSECCMAEQASIDDLVLRVQFQQRSCGAMLRRVHDTDHAHWSTHSLGLVNVCSFV
mmetsp:Transcript_11279/g.22885  ORF Transcript_11279/g.22885 Transcript_11279/m.22885 type:complete len:227 (-) Transcript_11279:131-811(-)